MQSVVQIKVPTDSLNNFETCKLNWDHPVLNNFKTNDSTTVQCESVGDPNSKHYLGNNFCERVCEIANQNLINKTDCSCGL